MLSKVVKSCQKLSKVVISVHKLSGKNQVCDKRTDRCKTRARVELRVAAKKIDEVLSKHVELPHVLPTSGPSFDFTFHVWP